jgi:hypothetical protein
MLTGVLLASRHSVRNLEIHLASDFGPGQDVRPLSVVAALLLFYLGLTLTYLTLPLAIKALLSSPRTT